VDAAGGFVRMKIQRKHIGASAGLLLLGAVMTEGCADDEGSIFIRGALVVPTDTCDVIADPSSPTLFGGTLDTALAGEYGAVLLVGNQLVRRGNTATVRVETSRVQFVEADVTVLSSAGDQIAAFRVPVSGFADPGTTGEPGYGAARVVLIDAVTAKSLGAQTGSSGVVQEIIASVIMRGHTLGGRDIESGAWQFPISVCQGCLVFFPGDADDTTTEAFDCNARDDAPTNCRVGLDSPVDCRICSAVSPVCRP
jgi:hypothetical protein